MLSGWTCLWDAHCALGEGPVWDNRHDELVFVDIKAPAIHRYRPADGRRLSWTPPARVSAVAPDANGGFIAASDIGFAHLDLDAHAFTVICNPEAGLEGNRFNDGKLDRQGRFWAGTMDDRELEARGTLYRLNPDLTFTAQDAGYSVTNGPAFSPDGSVMYHNDSGRRMTYAFDIDADGNPGPRRDFAHFTNAHGYPDGMTVDADGCLWIAFWDGWAVRRFDAGGRLLAEYRLPVQRPTSVTFGGPDCDRLFVTSACVGLNEAALAAQPLAGGLFELLTPARGLCSAVFGCGAY